MHSWVKGVQVCSNEGTWPFPRRDHSTIVKMCWQYFNTYSQEWLDQFQSNLAQSIDPWVIRIQVCSSEGPCPFSRVINSDHKKHCHLLKSSLELLMINQALYRHPCMDGINFFLQTKGHSFSQKGNNEFCFVICYFYLCTGKIISLLKLVYC